MKAIHQRRKIRLNKQAPMIVSVYVMKRYLSFTLCALFCSFVSAQQAKPSWASQLTSALPGKHPAIQAQKLQYQLSWKGQVQAGEVEFIFGGKGTNAQVLQASCEGKSLGLAANLFPYRFDMEGKIQRSSLAPQFMHCNETDKEETQVTTVRYHPGKVNVTEISRPHATGKDTTKNVSFAYAPVFDAFSSMLFIRSQALKQGDQIVQVIHPFKTPYLAKIQVLGRENVNGRAAIKMSIELTKITSTLELKPYKKMKTATLWISDDHHRVPLEMRVAAFIGDVRMTLKKQEVF
jgi:Protein of unknown function (DUF3108)